MTSDRLTELRTLHEAATAAPWRHINHNGSCVNIEGAFVEHGDHSRRAWDIGSPADAALIAAARNALPELLAALEAAEGALGEVVGLNGTCGEECPADCYADRMRKALAQIRALRTGETT